MAFNYAFEEASDGTFTIKDFQIFQLGRWFGHGGPEEGLQVGDSELASVLQADADHHDLIAPNVRRLHPVQGGGQEILGFLGRFKRAGDKILANIKGIPAAVFAEFKAGTLGRQSPIVRMNWTEPSTNSTLPMSIPHLDFIGGAMPAITSLKPAVSFADGEGCVTITLTGFKPLEKTAGQIALSGFEQAAPADNPETEVATMTKEIELERLRQENEKAVAELEKKEVAMADAQKAHELAMAEGAAKLHADKVDALMSNWMHKIPPAEVESTKTIALSLTDDTSYLAFVEQIKARVDVEAKNTKGSGPGSGEEKDTREVSVQMNEAIEKVLAENEGMSGLDALKIVEVQMSDVQMTEYYEEHRPSYDREVIKKKK